MINVAEILKQVPVGTKLWSNVFGEVKLIKLGSSNVSSGEEHIHIKTYNGGYYWFYPDGKYVDIRDGECTLWPSKDHRAWDDEAYKILGIEKKLEAPFELKPFDKVLIRDSYSDDWSADLFSHVDDDSYACYVCVGNRWKQCIPYNDETKHLLGMIQEPPEKYRI